jgi:hypothetical protein
MEGGRHPRMEEVEEGRIRRRAGRARSEAEWHSILGEGERRRASRDPPME